MKAEFLGQNIEDKEEERRECKEEWKKRRMIQQGKENYTGRE
jgi:hypothetical protein